MRRDWGRGPPVRRIRLSPATARPGDEAERLSPDTPQGKALMWREVGDEVSWQTERGTRMRVIVRYIQD
ncbi:hypothetical protein DBP12_14865 [Streptomyces sp. CS014]|nr:hypothetical protein DBP12_14865 [Streptomyces sp. CS014]